MPLWGRQIPYTMMKFGEQGPGVAAGMWLCVLYGRPRGCPAAAQQANHLLWLREQMLWQGAWVWLVCCARAAAECSGSRCHLLGMVR